jgi:HD-like signal output (HDOD) protein
MFTVTAELEELIDSTVTIPTTPTTLMKINQVVASPDGSAKDCAEIIVKDPAIAIKLLRLVNSSIYALSSPVSAVPLACSIVGMRVLKNIVVQATVLETFGTAPKIKGFDADWLWDHSFKTAIAARMLATAWPEAKLDKEEAYTSGLVHDVGKMVLAQSATKRFAEALYYSRSSKIPLARAEGEVLGFNHAHVAGLLAERWKLSPDLLVAVSYHHSAWTDANAWAKAFLIQAANTIAHEEAKCGGWIGDRCTPEAMAAMHVSDKSLQAIREQVRQATMQL